MIGGWWTGVFQYTDFKRQTFKLPMLRILHFHNKWQ